MGLPREARSGCCLVGSVPVVCLGFFMEHNSYNSYNVIIVIIAIIVIIVIIVIRVTKCTWVRS